MKYFFLFLLLLPMQVFAQQACVDAVDGYRMDWNNNYNWQNGSNTTSFTVNRPGGGDPVTVTMTFSGNTQFFTNPFGNSPEVSTLITGGNGAGQESLAYLVDFDNTSRQVTLDIVFSEPVENLQIPILDVDFGNATNGTGGFRDNVIITGRNTTVSTARFPANQTTTPFFSLPTTTQSPSTVQLFANNTGRGRGLTDNARPNENFGNMESSFTQTVTEARVFYNNSGLTTSNPGLQGIGIYDLQFCIPRRADLEATKTVLIHREDNLSCGVIPGTPEPGLPAAIPGSCIEYEISVENVGDGSATDVTVSDILDSTLIYRGSSISGFTAGPGYVTLQPTPGADCAITTCNVGVDNATLNIGQTGSIIIRAELK